MPYNYQLSEEAETDIYESYIWYESQRSMLGEIFLGSLDAAKKRRLSVILRLIEYAIRRKSEGM